MACDGSCYLLCEFHPQDLGRRVELSHRGPKSRDIDGQSVDLERRRNDEVELLVCQPLFPLVPLEDLDPDAWVVRSRCETTGASLPLTPYTFPLAKLVICDWRTDEECVE